MLGACFLLIINYSFLCVYGADINLNPTNNSVPNQQKINSEQQKNSPEQPPASAPIENKPSPPIKPPAITIKKNNPPETSKATNSTPPPTQNNIQKKPEPQPPVVDEQPQQNFEETEVPKKENKEKAKNAGNFVATYPQAFSWEADLEPSSESKPKDLPEVKEEEIELPEVITVTESKNKSSVSLFAGVIAWICILVGVGIILFVLFMNKKSGEFPIDTEKSSKKRKFIKHGKYYKNNL